MRSNGPLFSAHSATAQPFGKTAPIIRHPRYETFAVALVLGTAAFGAPVEKLTGFELADQNSKTRIYRFPKSKVAVMTVADHKGSGELAPWIQRLHDRYQKKIDIDGVADVSKIPKPLHAIFRAPFRKQLAYSVMLDWDGTVVKQFAYKKGVANFYVIDREGRVLNQITGPISDAAEAQLTREIDRAVTGRVTYLPSPGGCRYAGAGVSVFRKNFASQSRSFKASQRV